MTDDKLRQEAKAAAIEYADSRSPRKSASNIPLDMWNENAWAFIAGYLAHAAKAEVLVKALGQIAEGPKGSRPTDIDAHYAHKTAREALHAYRKGSDE